MEYTLVVSTVAALVIFLTVIIMQMPLTGYPAVDWLLFVLMGLGPGLGVCSAQLGPEIRQSADSGGFHPGRIGYGEYFGLIIFNEALVWYQLSGGA